MSDESIAILAGSMLAHFVMKLPSLSNFWTRHAIAHTRTLTQGGMIRLNQNCGDLMGRMMKWSSNK